MKSSTLWCTVITQLMAAIRRRNTYFSLAGLRRSLSGSNSILENDNAITCRALWHSSSSSSSKLWFPCMCLLMGNDGVAAQIHAQIWQLSLLGLDAAQEIIHYIYIRSVVCLLIGRRIGLRGSRFCLLDTQPNWMVITAIENKASM